MFDQNLSYIPMFYVLRQDFSFKGLRSDWQKWLKYNSKFKQIGTATT
jgi:hypothetical protein